MNAARPHLTRRRFLGIASAAALMAAGPAPRALAGDRQLKTILSFYCDDTSPYVAGAKAFETFLDYCAEHGIAGESSPFWAWAVTACAANRIRRSKHFFIKLHGRGNVASTPTWN